MRAVFFCLGVLTAGSLMGGSATAQFVPGPSFLGDLGDTGFVPTSAFPPPVSGFGFPGVSGVGAGAGLPSEAAAVPESMIPQQRMQPNIRRRSPSNRYGYGTTPGGASFQAAPTPLTQQAPYFPQIPHATQVPTIQPPSFGPFLPSASQPQTTPYLPFAPQPQFMMTIPMLPLDINR